MSGRTLNPVGMDATTGQFEISQFGDIMVGTPTDDSQLANSAGYQTVSAGAAAIAAAEASDASTYQTKLPITGGLAGTYANPSSITVNSQGLVTALMAGSAPPSTARVTSALSLSLVGAGATGTQISPTKDSTIRITGTDSTTATIGGASASFIKLMKCATNSATESDWTTFSTLTNSQTVTLAVILQSLQGTGGELEMDVPAGWFVKVESGGSGTHAEVLVYGEKTIYG